jgi:hypothetical protein
MANEGRGNLFKVKGSKYLLYLPVCVTYDSMFPFKCDKSMHVKVSFKHDGEMLVIEKWSEIENHTA